MSQGTALRWEVLGTGNVQIKYGSSKNNVCVSVGLMESRSNRKRHQMWFGHLRLAEHIVHFGERRNACKVKLNAR
jgi:hypothetical protein